MSRLFVVAGAFLLTFVWAVVSVSAQEKGRPQPKVDKAFDDAEFVKKAASGGMFEVELGKVAKEKSADGEVRRFGERMVTDHTKANKELTDVAKAAGYAVPTKMMVKHQEHLDAFKKESGKTFDQDYIKHMVKDHEEDIEEFDRASREARNPELKAFATKALPTLKEHLEMARRIRDAMTRK